MVEDDEADVPDMPLEWTQPANIPAHRWAWMHICFDHHGRLDVALYEALRDRIPLREFRDIEEGRTVTRDRQEAMEAYVRKHPSLAGLI